MTAKNMTASHSNYATHQHSGSCIQENAASQHPAQRRIVSLFVSDARRCTSQRVTGRPLVGLGVRERVCNPRSVQATLVPPPNCPRKRTESSNAGTSGSKCEMPKSAKLHAMASSALGVNLERGGGVEKSRFLEPKEEPTCGPVLKKDALFESPCGLWRIRGLWYDLEPFLDRHPGGKNVLVMLRDADATLALKLTT